VMLAGGALVKALGAAMSEVEYVWPQQPFREPGARPDTLLLSISPATGKFSQMLSLSRPFQSTIFRFTMDAQSLPPSGCPFLGELLA
jgi:hypothetical protein